jgi:hypothetical protein
MTAMESDLLAWLEHCARLGEPCPRNDEICGRFNFGSGATASRMIKNLEAAGTIRVERFQTSRMVTIIATGDSTQRPANTAPHWRDRSSSAPSSLLEDVKEEAIAAASRRALARSTGTVARPVPAATGPALQVTTAMLAEPSDLVAMLKRRWPDLWQQVIASAHAVGASPVAHLIEIIETGVSA